MKQVAAAIAVASQLGHWWVTAGAPVRRSIVAQASQQGRMESITFIALHLRCYCDGDVTFERPARPCSAAAETSRRPSSDVPVSTLNDMNIRYNNYVVYIMY